MNHSPLQQLLQALEVYDAALKLCPDSSELKTKLKLLGKVARKQQQTLNSQAKQVAASEAAAAAAAAWTAAIA
jgi:hypothetical protein